VKKLSATDLVVFTVAAMRVSRGFPDLLSPS
jgi:hypothetical protein